MNVLDEKFAEFQKLPTEDRIECFEKDGRLFDMIRSQQLNREIIDDIYGITNQLRQISKKKGRLSFRAEAPLPQTGNALVYPAFVQDLFIL